MDKYKLWDSATIVRRRLLESPELRQMVGSRIHPVISPEGTSGDRIVVVRTQYGRERTKAGYYSDVCRVAVVVYSASYDRGVQIMQTVDEVLDGDWDGGGGLMQERTAPMVDSEEDWEAGYYIQTAVFELTNMLKNYE